MTPIRVVAVDDHFLIREGIRHLLAVHDDVALVAEAGAGEQILPLVELHRPQVLLLDLGLPVHADPAMSSGSRFPIIPTLYQLQRRFPQTRVIVLSQYDAGPLARAAMQAGVQGYLLKDDALTAHLVEAIRAVHADGVYFSQRIRHLLSDAESLLTQRQLEILSLLAVQPELPRTVLACRLHISQNTLTDHLRKIYQTLGVRTLPAALLKAMQMGLLPTPADDIYPPDVDQEG
jgi:DNA-binding NarL/FixJ family response regulator